MGAMTGTVNSSRRGPSKLLVLAASTLATLVLGEIAVRWLVLGESAAAARFGAKLRKPEHFARDVGDDDYWKLQALFTDPANEARVNTDPVLGWTAGIAPGTYVHPDEARSGDRRPILLFGDSFAACVVPPEHCWQGLFVETELARDHALLNFGAGGYGLDQVALLIERVLPRFAGRDPIVVVGVLVDDDLERCALSIRCWPKPRFTLRGGELELETPGETTTRAWLAEHPPSIRSYLGRLAAHAFASKGRFAPSYTDPDRIPAQRELALALLARIHATLRAHGVERSFLVSFAGEGALQDTPRARWQEDTLVEFSRASGMPCVATRPYLEAAALDDRVTMGSLFGSNDPMQAGHYNDAGNRAAFEAILQGLRGDFGAPKLDAIRERARAGGFAPRNDLPRHFRVQDRVGQMIARSWEPCVRAANLPDGTARLSVRPGEDGSCLVELPLLGATRMRARARAVAMPGQACGDEPLELVVAAASTTPVRIERAIGGADEELVVEALSGDTLTLRLTRAGSKPMCAWLVLEGLRFE